MANNWRFPLLRSGIVSYVIALFVLPTAPILAQAPGAWRNSAWHLWRIDVDGSNLKSLDATENARCGSPDWSPDGKFIVYDVLDDVMGGFRIAVVRSDGTDRRILRRGSLPSWSPDGRLICAQGEGLQIFNSDGTGQESFAVPAHSLRWSPRGNYIASSMGDTFGIFDLATGKQRHVRTGLPSISHGYGISPDGTRLCAGTARNGLWVVTFTDQMKNFTTRQVVGTGTAYHASWAPDGKRVAFAWRPTDDALTQIYTLDVDSNDEPRVLPGIDTSHENVNPDWSPDGKSIVFSTRMPLTEPAF